MDYGVHAVVTDCERDHVTWNTKPNLEQETKSKLPPFYQHDECLFYMGQWIWGPTSERIGFDFVDIYEFVNGEVTTSGQSNDNCEYWIYNLMNWIIVNILPIISHPG